MKNNNNIKKEVGQTKQLLLKYGIKRFFLIGISIGTTKIISQRWLVLMVSSKI